MKTLKNYSGLIVFMGFLILFLILTYIADEVNKSRYVAPSSPESVKVVRNTLNDARYDKD